MLEQFFGSKTRVKLLRMFLNSPDDYFFIRQITRNIDAQINAVRRELSNLENIGIIKAYMFSEDENEGAYLEIRDIKKSAYNQKKQKKFYKLNTGFILYSEINTLFLKSQFLLERDIVEKIRKLGNVSHLILSGVFVGERDVPVDILIVGQIEKKKINNLIEKVQKIINHDINYTVMSDKDFKYRKDVFDQFLYKILNSKKMVFSEKDGEDAFDNVRGNYQV